MGGVDSRIAFRAAVHKKAAGNIDGDNLVAGSIEMLYQPDGHSFRSAVETGTQQGIDDDIAGGNGSKLFLSLYEPDLDRGLVQTCEIDLEIVGSLMPEFQDMNRNRTSVNRQHSGQGQAIAAIIALAAIDRKRTAQIPGGLKPVKASLCRPFHQIDGGDGFVLHRKFVPGANLLRR